MRVLIANRGEIALRLIRACHELGWEAVAVYSEVDEEQPYVTAADLAIPIGKASPRESYLNIPVLLEAARRGSCHAVHPGYGFLAENPDFARQVRGAGLVWMGPHPETIELLGSKTQARELAHRVGVPVVPGTAPLDRLEEAKKFARDVGYPVLLKAVGGGGGKGMRVVEDEASLEESWQRAQAEGKAFFGDPRIYAEKLLAAPRHVEVQFLADAFGHVVHLGERECSLQRRHQKLVEESPSLAVSPSLREELGRQAVALAREAGYVTAGTAEFLLCPDGNFYFLEVNTRLQVEHPVTEMVYGVDLAQWMMQLALGERLTLQQETLVPRGHAIECRIYAEDPRNNFAPSPGVVTVYQEPGGPGVRVDSGITQGSLVPMEYDPILAKLIVWGENREQALARLHRALAEYVLLGVATTLSLYQYLCQDQGFIAGEVHTSYLPSVIEAFQSRSQHPIPVAIAAALELSGIGLATGDPFAHELELQPWREAGGRMLRRGPCR